VLKRAGWVLKHIRQAREQREYVLPRRYVSGESHLYLGRRYQLKVSQSWDSRTEVKLTRGRFLVAAPDASPETVKAALKDWYRQHGLQYIGNRLEAVCDRVPWVSTIPSWRLRVMRKQWGSCSNKGNLSFNTHLVKAPRQCIDYVILHELCHLREHNHSRYFYRLLSDQLPDWKSLKTRLDGMAEILLNE
jgi:hypothetical protein